MGRFPCRSPIDSSRALWVLGEARLISSASRMSVKTGPGWNLNSCVRGSNTEIPRISDGRRSGVNCTRLKTAPLIALAIALAKVVFPVPGKSSSSTWPPETMQAKTRRTTSACPLTTEHTADSRRLAVWRMLMGSAPIPAGMTRAVEIFSFVGKGIRAAARCMVEDRNTPSPGFAPEITPPHQCKCNRPALHQERRADRLEASG
jgi:hypothetical protein